MNNREDVPKQIPKTVLNEEIKEGDQIMYMYKSYGNLQIAFGTVVKITWKKYEWYSFQPFNIQLRRTYVLNGWETGPCDVLVNLSNPTAFHVKDFTIKLPEGCVI